MNELVINQVLNGFSTLGVVVFAISGALYAAERKMDIIGFILIGTVTAIGGGTLRDLLLGVGPVSWVANPVNAYLCIASCTATYFLVSLVRDRQAWILWMDAIGLAAFAVLGAEAALAQNVAPVVAVVMGVMSATFGGIIRDVLCAEVFTLMKPELYITCALLAAVLYVIPLQFGMSPSGAAVMAFSGGFALRAAAIIWGWQLPQWQEKQHGELQ